MRFDIKISIFFQKISRNPRKRTKEPTPSEKGLAKRNGAGAEVKEHMYNYRPFFLSSLR